MARSKQNRKLIKQLPKDERKVMELFKRAQNRSLAGDHKKVIELCDQGLAMKPRQPALLHLKGRSLLSLGQYKEAREAMEVVAEQSSHKPQVLVDLARSFIETDDWEEAVPLLERALVLQPHGLEPLQWMGRAYWKLRQMDEAERYYRWFINAAEAKGKKVPGAWAMLGSIMREKGDPLAAIECFEKSMEMDTEKPTACYNAGFAAMDLGRPVQGAHLIELGFTLGLRGFMRRFKAKRWQGEDITGKNVLIWREQGVGDELAHAILYNWVIERAEHVTIEATPKITSLLARSFPRATVLPDQPASLEKFNDDLARTDCEYETPSAAIPIGIGESDEVVADIMRSQGPYLIPDPERVAFWKRRIDALGPGLKVGLCWRSGLLKRERLHNYFQIEDCAPLFRLPGIVWINQQYDECAEELAIAREQFGVDLHTWDDINLKDDLDDVAAMMKCLDLVISPATAVRALSTGVGVPTWVLLPFATRPDAPPERLASDPEHVTNWRHHWNEPWYRVTARMAEHLHNAIESAKAQAG